MPMNLLHYRILYYPFLGRNTVYPPTHQSHYHPTLYINRIFTNETYSGWLSSLLSFCSFSSSLNFYYKKLLNVALTYSII